MLLSLSAGRRNKNLNRRWLSNMDQLQNLDPFLVAVVIWALYRAKLCQRNAKSDFKTRSGKPCLCEEDVRDLQHVYTKTCQVTLKCSCLFTAIIIWYISISYIWFRLINRSIDNCALGSLLVLIMFTLQGTTLTKTTSSKGSRCSCIGQLLCTAQTNHIKEEAD